MCVCDYGFVNKLIICSLFAGPEDFNITVIHDNESEGYNLKPIEELYAGEPSQMLLTEVDSEATHYKDYFNFIDCGLYAAENHSDAIITKDCERETVVGFICEAGIPDREAFGIHPDHDLLHLHLEVLRRYGP